jgi:hypothetical protein
MNNSTRTSHKRPRPYTQGHFLLVALLKPLLQKSETRVVVLASCAVRRCFFIFFITLGLEMSDTKVYEP